MSLFCFRFHNFSDRLIELGKLELKTAQRDKHEYSINSTIRKVKNKSGIVETRANTCIECSEEYCDGRTCLDFNYDLYVRIMPKLAQFKGKTNGRNVNQGKLTHRKKSKSINGEKVKIKRRNRSVSPTKCDKK